VWDNGVSTTPDSTLAVYESLPAPVCLLVGGKSKDLPFDAMVAAARGKVARVVAFGHAGPQLQQAFSAAGIEAVAMPTVRAAVAEAYARMQPDEDLLFSPACASYDAYKNFKERAEDFRQALPAPSAPAGA
jgi:UDP-N-acetylmuramoylalanine--D-glutamate ligase